MRMKLWLALLIGIFSLASCNFPLFQNPPAPDAVINPPAVTLALPTETEAPTATAAPQQMDSTEPFQLAILTPAEFVPVLQPLADYKNQTGMPTRIITLEEIYTKCDGRDQAEQVKICLEQLARVNGIHFAMLVGDMDKFPVRFTKADRDAAEAGYTAFFPTDLYYADLFKADGSFDNWDANNNGYYGEICGEITTCPLNSDQVDLQPDIAVGRIPASDEKEVAIYVQKVITYESTAANSTWAKKVLLIATTTWLPDACKNEEGVVESLPKGYTSIRLYEEGSPCAADEPLTNESLVQALNSDGKSDAHLELDNGILNIEDVLSEIRGCGYDGDAIVELYSVSLNDPERVVSGAARVLGI